MTDEINSDAERIHGKGYSMIKSAFTPGETAGETVRQHTYWKPLPY
jgi:hypothetical protein